MINKKGMFSITKGNDEKENKGIIHQKKSIKKSQNFMLKKLILMEYLEIELKKNLNTIKMKLIFMELVFLEIKLKKNLNTIKMKLIFMELVFLE